MEDRLSGRVLRHRTSETDPRPSLGEIGLNQFAPYFLNRVAAHWNALMTAGLKAEDMTTVRMRALAVLSVVPVLTVNELSELAVTEQSTMSRTLDALEEQGFISRQPRSDDMRVRDISITEAGRMQFEKVWPLLYDNFLKMFSGVSEEDYRAFILTLYKILTNIRDAEQA